MYCEHCERHFVGGSICSSCGGKLERVKVAYSRFGEPLFHVADAPMRGPGRPGEPLTGPRREGNDVGHSAGPFVRFCYKVLESVFACALFSVAFRLVIFLVKVVDSLTETGGDIKEGISFFEDMQRAIGWYEVGVWLIIALLIFRYRHTPE